MTNYADLVAHLRNGQQADMDGTIVIVSRQACEEAADAIERLISERNMAIAAAANTARDVVSRAAAVDGIARLADDCDRMIRDGHPFPDGLKARKDALLSAVGVMHRLPALHAPAGEPVAWGVGPALYVDDERDVAQEDRK